jgi:hypothetical protein
MLTASVRGPDDVLLDLAGTMSSPVPVETTP